VSVREDADRAFDTCSILPVESAMVSILILELRVP